MITIMITTNSAILIAGIAIVLILGIKRIKNILDI
jgi:hypothetical protein